MNKENENKVPKWFMPVASVALVWNIVGVAAYLGQMTMDVTSLADAERQFYASIPAWATAAFAIAVFAGTAGSIGLLLKKRWALPVLIVSFLGIALQVGHSLLLSNGLDVFGPSAFVLPLLTLAIGLALIFLARIAQNKNWF